MDMFRVLQTGVFESVSGNGGIEQEEETVCVIIK